MKKSKFLLIVLVSLCVTLLSGNAFEVIHAVDSDLSVASAVLSNELKAKLNSINDEDKVDIAIWQQDIDHENVRLQAENDVSVKSLSLTENATMETIQKFIAKKRYYAMIQYEDMNKKLVDNVVSKSSETEVVFVSRFSPVVIFSMSKRDALSATKGANIERMELFVESEVVDCSNVAHANSGVEYLRETPSINATGKGVKIGQIEKNVLDSNLSYNGVNYFKSENLHLIGQLPSKNEPNHPNLVASIMVGQPITYVSKTYKGVAPDAELYYAAMLNKVNTMAVIEEMISPENGVNIINMSAGWSNEITYTFFCQWIDHLAFSHDVHFVAAAGNYSGDYNPGNNVLCAALAYNAIAVGNVADGGVYIENNAPDSLDKQYLKSTFGIVNASSYVLDSSYTGYKPDIAAWGKNINYGHLLQNSGTSFSAPLVAGIIAQLCETNPSLLTNNSKVKALLAATAVYRAPTSATIPIYASEDEVYTDCCMTQKQGAGIVNAVCAYRTINAGKTKDVTMSGGQQYYSFTINVPSSYNYLRLSMAWIKKNSISGSHVSEDSTINNNQLADLKLEIFYGSDTSGTPVAWSDSLGNNLELLQFDVASGGTYTVRITNKSYSNGLGAQYISLAWY